MSCHRHSWRLFPAHPRQPCPEGHLVGPFTSQTLQPQGTLLKGRAKSQLDKGGNTAHRLCDSAWYCHRVDITVVHLHIHIIEEEALKREHRRSKFHQAETHLQDGSDIELDHEQHGVQPEQVSFLLNLDAIAGVQVRVHPTLIAQDDSASEPACA